MIDLTRLLPPPYDSSEVALENTASLSSRALMFVFTKFTSWMKETIAQPHREWYNLETALKQGKFPQAQELAQRIDHAYKQTLLTYIQNNEKEKALSLVQGIIEQQEGILSKLGYHHSYIKEALLQKPPLYLVALQNFLEELSSHFEKWQESEAKSQEASSLVSQLIQTFSEEDADEKRLQLFNQLKSLPHVDKTILGHVRNALDSASSVKNATERLTSAQQAFELKEKTLKASLAALAKIQELEAELETSDLTVFSLDEQALLRQAPSKLRQWLGQDASLGKRQIDPLLEQVSYLRAKKTGLLPGLGVECRKALNTALPEPLLSLEELNRSIDALLEPIPQQLPPDREQITTLIQKDLEEVTELSIQLILSSITSYKALQTLLYPLVKFYLSSITHNLMRDLYAFLETQEKENFNTLLRSCLKMAKESYEDLLHAYKEAKTEKELKALVSTFTYGNQFSAEEVETRFLRWFFAQFMPSFDPTPFVQSLIDTLFIKHRNLYYLSFPLISAVKIALFIAKPLFYLFRKMHNTTLLYTLRFFNVMPHSFHRVKKMFGIYGGNTPIFDSYLLKKIKQLRSLNAEDFENLPLQGLTVPQEDVQEITKINLLFFDLLERHISPGRQNALNAPLEVLCQSGLIDETLRGVSLTLAGALRKFLTREEILEVVYCRLKDVKESLLNPPSLNSAQTQILETNAYDALFKTLQVQLLSIHPRALHLFSPIKTRVFGLFSLLKNEAHFDTLAHGALCIKA